MGQETAVCKQILNITVWSGSNRNEAMQFKLISTNSISKQRINWLEPLFHQLIRLPSYGKIFRNQTPMNNIVLTDSMPLFRQLVRLQSCSETITHQTPMNNTVALQKNELQLCILPKHFTLTSNTIKNNIECTHKIHNVQNNFN